MWFVIGFVAGAVFFGGVGWIAGATGWPFWSWED